MIFLCWLFWMHNYALKTSYMIGFDLFFPFAGLTKSIFSDQSHRSIFYLSLF